MEISIQGVTKVNYELVVDDDVFNLCCEDAGLDPANFKNFTKTSGTNVILIWFRL